MFKAVLIFSVLFSAYGAQAASTQTCDGSRCTFTYENRQESECSDLNVEMADWFRGDIKGKAPINKTLGQVRDQGQVGWCFAHAAADLITAETGVYVSGAQIAKNYYDKSMLASILRFKEGGFIDAALKLSFNKPLCDEATTPSAYVVPGNLKNLSCESPVVNLKKDYSVYKSQVVKLGEGGLLFPELDAVLEKGKIAGIHYNVSMVMDQKLPFYSTSWSNHASSIVGRFFDRDSKVCRYIVRNTWGNYCSSYGRKFKCKEGYYAIAEEYLNESLGQIVTLEQK